MEEVTVCITCDLLVKTKIIKVRIFEMEPSSSFGETFKHVGLFDSYSTIIHVKPVEFIHGEI